MPSRQRTYLWIILALFLIGTLIGISAGPMVQAAPLAQTPALSVVINEVAWGGTAASTADEWIELYNPGPSPIDLAGWRLVADDGTPNITLAGTILAGGYYLLERTNDDTVSGIIADLIYTEEQLVNTGERLRLIAPDSSQVDTANLDGGSWPAGSASPGCYSMERIGVTTESDAVWQSNDGVTRNGLDESSNPINGTPKMPNSYLFIPTSTSTPTATETDINSATPTNTATNTGTATNTPLAPAFLVISEFRTRGPNGADDEFVEIYNPTGAAVNIGGWRIRRSSVTGSTTYSLVTITTGTLLLPGQHYLVAATGSTVPAPDQTFSPGIADEGGIALANAAGTIVDQVGMSTTTLYKEVTPLAPLVGSLDQSYERLPGGQTHCYDTNNNANDFRLITPSNLQPRSSPAVMCAGVLTATPTPTASRTPTRTSTALPTPFPGILVINEFLPRPRTDWNADGVTNVEDEFIEIMNMGTEPVNLKNWKLDDDVGGSTPYTFPDLTIQPRQMIVFFRSETGILLGDGGDSVRLLRPGGQTADIYNYPVVPTADQSWCRLPDGSGLWTFGCRPSMGRPNALADGGSEPGGSGTGGTGSTNLPCQLPAEIPQAIREAECDGWWVWNVGFWTGWEIWLESRWKWDIFLQ